MTDLLNDSPVLRASNYIDANQELVASASLLTAAIVATLKDRPDVTVDFGGMRSTSSSYFNTVLSGVAGQFGVDAIRAKVTYRFSSAAQQEIFKRSFDAVLRDLGV